MPDRKAALCQLLPRPPDLPTDDSNEDGLCQVGTESFQHGGTASYQVHVLADVRNWVRDQMGANIVRQIMHSDIQIRG
eukprot:6799932-Pyramimonas_sp.AAC.1